MLAGAYPASLDDLETEQLLSLLLELGVTTFVCLQAEVNIHIPGESGWAFACAGFAIKREVCVNWGCK